MTIELKSVDFNDKEWIANIDRYPDECPRCHANVSPKICKSYLVGVGLQSYGLELICRCPNSKCGKVFLGQYQGHEQVGARYNWYFYNNVIPYVPIAPELPEIIKKISAGFISIYSQAAVAERFGLKLVAGPGYRKALEFLIKDYLVRNKVRLKVTKKDIIDEKLGNCIQKYIDDNLIKETARRAAWLGNDETHYNRLWKDKDIEDLKALLKITINFIQNASLAAKYFKEMPATIRG